MYHLTDYTFVGLENYLTVFSGSIKNVFFPVLGWTICFALLSTAGSYAMGLILAILLNNPHMKESKILPCSANCSVGIAIYDCNPRMAGTAK